MFWKKSCPIQKQCDRKVEHATCMELVNTFRSPVRELALAILPPSCDPEWEDGWHAVKKRYMERVDQFEKMHNVMQAQRVGRRDLRVVGD